MVPRNTILSETTASAAFNHCVNVFRSIMTCDTTKGPCESGEPYGLFDCRLNECFEGNCDSLTTACGTSVRNTGNTAKQTIGEGVG